jgi:hypothetical protein
MWPFKKKGIIIVKEKKLTRNEQLLKDIEEGNYLTIEEKNGNRY